MTWANEGENEAPLKSLLSAPTGVPAGNADAEGSSATEKLPPPQEIGIAAAAVNSAAVAGTAAAAPCGRSPRQLHDFMWPSGYAQPRYLSASDAEKGRLKGQAASAAARKKRDSWSPLLGTKNHCQIEPRPHVLHCQGQVNMMCFYNLACCCWQAISLTCCH